MRGLYKKIIGIFLLVISCAILIQVQRMGYLKSNVQRYFNDSSEVMVNKTAVNKISESKIQNKDKTLIVYDASDAKLVSYKDVMEQTCKYLKAKSNNN